MSTKTLKMALMGAALTISIPFIAHSEPGEIDTSFGSGGASITNIGGSDFVNDVAIQPNGKIVLVGHTTGEGGLYDIALLRYNEDGSLDIGFGTSGIVRTPVGDANDLGHAVAIQPDGKIIVAGYRDKTGTTNTTDVVLVRYHPDGSLDRGFGTGDTEGIVIHDPGYNEVGRDVAIQPGGKIVVGGYVSRGDNEDFAVWRFDSNGHLDTDFGSNGQATADFGSNLDKAYALTIQPVDGDNKIILAGYTRATSTGSTGVALARFNSDGEIDTGFGSGGMVTTDISSAHDFGYAVAIQPDDGKIVVAGKSFAVLRFTSRGDLDMEFDGDGIKTDIGLGGGEAWGVVVQPDHKIVLGGDTWTGSSHDFALACLNPNGSLDTGFGNNGIKTQDVGGMSNYGRGVALHQLTGKIIVGGYQTPSGQEDFLVAKFLGGPPPPTADLMAMMQGDSTRARINRPFRYRFAAQNNGPTPAEGVVLTHTLPGSFTVNEVLVSQGSCTNELTGASMTITCLLGRIDAGRNAGGSVTLTPTTWGNFTIAGDVTGSMPDPNLDNNHTSFNIRASGQRNRWWR